MTDDVTTQKIVRYTEALLRFRWVVILAALLVVGGLGSGAQNLGFTDDYRAFFGPDNPQLQAFEEIQNVYTKNDNILFVVTPKSGQVFSQETLAAIEALTEGGWQIPFARRVDSVTNFQHTWAEEDDLIVEDLVSGAELLSPEELKEKEQVALSEPLIRGRILNDEADVTAVNVTLQLAGESIDEINDAVTAARELRERIAAEHPNHEIRLTGFAMLNNAFRESSLGDMATLMPAMYGIILLFLVILFRSVAATFATLLVVGLSTVAAMGAAGWAGLMLTPPSSIAPTLILTLAVADSVHILKGFLVALADGLDRRAALAESLRRNLWPVFLTSASTAIGFLSMNFSDSPPFHDLGNITAFGVMAAFFVSVTFLPALVSLLPFKAERQKKDSGRWDTFGRWVLARRQPLLIGIGLLTLGLTLMVPSNKLNDQFVEYFAESVPFRADTDYTVENLTGIYQVEFSLSSGESGGVAEPEYLKTLDRFAEWWRAQPGVTHVRTLSDTMRRINRSMHGDDPDQYVLPESRELAAQYLLLYELSLPYGLDLNDQIDIDKSATRFTVTTENLSANDQIALAETGEKWLEDNAPASMISRGVGPTLMFSHISQRNASRMLQGTFFALLLISGILVLALRSWRYGLLSLIPNLAPAGLAFGFWALTVGEVNLALSMVVAMTLGIVVDDTVHFLAKYQRGRRDLEMNAEDSVLYAFRSVGSALWTTSLVLVAGFLLLSLSTFEMNAGMGRLTAVTILLALLVDFLFLPAVLVTFDRDRRVSD